MTRRKKVTLAYIANDVERRASYKKRMKGLIKKVKELSTLCDVQACAIIYSPYDAQPTVWPSPTEAQDVLDRFNNLSLMDRTRKMMNQEGFTRQRVKKTEDAVRRLQKENKRNELDLYMHKCIAGKASLQEFNISDAAEMNLVINNAVREINAKMEKLKKIGLHQAQPADASGSGSEAGLQQDLHVVPPPLHQQDWSVVISQPHRQQDLIPPPPQQLLHQHHFRALPPLPPPPQPLHQQDFRALPPPPLHQYDLNALPPQPLHQQDSRALPPPLHQYDLSALPPQPLHQQDFRTLPPPPTPLHQHDFNALPPPPLHQREWIVGPHPPLFRQDFNALPPQAPLVVTAPPPTDSMENFLWNWVADSPRFGIGTEVQHTGFGWDDGTCQAYQNVFNNIDQASNSTNPSYVPSNIDLASTSRIPPGDKSN